MTFAPRNVGHNTCFTFLPMESTTRSSAVLIYLNPLPVTHQLVLLFPSRPPQYAERTKALWETSPKKCR